MISGLSGETGRASPSGSGALGDEALCLPLLVDSREGPWEPGDKMQVTENQNGQGREGGDKTKSPLGKKPCPVVLKIQIVSCANNIT